MKIYSFFLSPCARGFIKRSFCPEQVVPAPHNLVVRPAAAHGIFIGVPLLVPLTFEMSLLYFLACMH